MVLMSIPTVAIVGRTNVGKSTLFNQLVGRRIAITDPTAGTTRDRIFHPLEWYDPDGHLHRFELMDTGGLGIVDHQDLSDLVEHQIEVGIGGADVLVFLVDAQEGVTPQDQVIAARLRKTGIPLVLVANKADNQQLQDRTAEFYNLALDDVTAISAAHRRGLDDLLDRIVQVLPRQSTERGALVDDEDVLKLAIVGRRNVGKSTFVNRLAGHENGNERVIASDTPGTTRDSIDVRIERDGEVFIVTDTAGMRRKRSLESTIEFFAIARTERAIRRAAVVVLMLDAKDGISQVDKKIADHVREAAKPCVIAINKWDLAGDDVITSEYEAYIAKQLPLLGFAPLIFTCAEKGRNVWQCVRIARELWEQARRTHRTSELNRAIRDAIAAHAPHAKRGKLPKIYYAAQVGTEPPTLALFVNDPRLFGAEYVRYLENRMREALGIPEIPIRIVLKPRSRKSKGRTSTEPSLTPEGLIPPPSSDSAASSKDAGVDATTSDVSAEGAE